MKFLICAAVLIVGAQALPNPYLGYGAVPIGTQSTYHAQDELGQYSFGYQEPNQVRSETKDAFGVVRGSYSYTNADGSIVVNNYIADENGFRSSLAPSNGPLLPVVGKPPRVGVEYAPVASIASAPVSVAATPAVKDEKPSVVKTAGGHVAPAPPVASSPFAYSPYAYGYPAYHYAYSSPYNYVHPW